MRQQTRYGFDLSVPRQTMPECRRAPKRISGQWFRRSCSLASHSNDMAAPHYGGQCRWRVPWRLVGISGSILPTRLADSSADKEAHMRPRIFALGMFVLGLTACDVTSTVTEGSKQARAVETAL